MIDELALKAILLQIQWTGSPFVHAFPYGGGWRARSVFPAHFCSWEPRHGWFCSTGTLTRSVEGTVGRHLCLGRSLPAQ